MMIIMYLSTALFVTGFSCLIAFGLLAYVFNIKQQTQGIIFMLMICVYLYTYLFGLDQYRESHYQKALDSQQQFSQCAEFVRQIQFNRGRKNSYETAYQFKTDQSAFIEFNGDLPTLKHVPQLTQLQQGQRYCLRYTADIKDWNGRWMITALQAE
jgi:hypothetical protein